MKYQLRHTTRYRYSSSVTLSHNEARLLPRNIDWQHCTQTRLTIIPAPQRQHERRDFFGNRVAYFAIQDIHDSLEVTANSLVTTEVRPVPEGDACMVPWENAVEQLTPQTQASDTSDALGALRSIGIPARYVSGYLETLPPPGQQKLVGADASHAWLSVFIPGWGWLDIDPTNGSLPDERYLTLGWGRDYGDVTPLKGVMNGGGAHELEVEVDVVAVD